MARTGRSCEALPAPWTSISPRHARVGHVACKGAKSVAANNTDETGGHARRRPAANAGDLAVCSPHALPTRVKPAVQVVQSVADVQALQPAVQLVQTPLFFHVPVGQEATAAGWDVWLGAEQQDQPVQLMVARYSKHHTGFVRMPMQISKALVAGMPRSQTRKVRWTWLACCSPQAPPRRANPAVQEVQLVMEAHVAQLSGQDTQVAPNFTVPAGQEATVGGRLVCRDAIVRAAGAKGAALRKCSAPDTLATQQWSKRGIQPEPTAFALPKDLIRGTQLAASGHREHQQRDRDQERRSCGESPPGQAAAGAGAAVERHCLCLGYCCVPGVFIRVFLGGDKE